MAKRLKKSHSTLDEAIQEFSIVLYRTCLLSAGKAANLFLSPYSISASLMLTMLGTRGNSESQIKAALNLDGFSSNLHEEFGKLHLLLTSTIGKKVTLAIANRVFSEMGYTIPEEYKKLSSEHYKSELTLLDFVKKPEASRKFINNWIEKQTKNKIKELIPPGGINSRSSIVLTNAIYFKGDWKKPFKSSNTRREKFYISSDKWKMTSMMNMGKAMWLYGSSQSLDCKILQLPYKGDRLSMLVVLPNKINGLVKLEERLSVETLSKLKDTFKTREVIVAMPKFKTEYSFQLEKALVSMGIKDIFSKRADFSAMFTKPKDDVQVSSVIHKAFVEVNEQGTVAAAATTVVLLPKKKATKKPLTFKANHPFLFLIIDKINGTILFIGRFVQPPK